VNKSDNVSVGGTINFPLSFRTPLGNRKPYCSPTRGQHFTYPVW